MIDPAAPRERVNVTLRNADSIPVTKAFLPPQDHYRRYLDEIWERGWLTNHGPLVREFERQLQMRLGLDHILYVANGTLALQIAIRAMELKGEVITTPFSYVATSSSILWEGCMPVMVDIDSATLTIDPEKIEAAITDRTSGILATHVYGNACDIERIEEIALRHGLHVIYDGAHAFGTLYDGRPIFQFGDITTASFHATKVFHTIEGGAVCTASPDIAQKAGLLRNFGHTGPNTFACVGINAKNSEFHAAMGLCNLGYIDVNLRQRRQVVERYNHNLALTALRRPRIADRCQWNCAYYPVICESEAALQRIVTDLNAHGIQPRRYFYPSLSTLPFVDRRCQTPISDDAAPRVLCLPLYPSLSLADVDWICSLVAASLAA